MVAAFRGDRALTQTDPINAGLDRLREAQRSRERVRDQYQSLREGLQDDSPPDRTLDRPETCWNCGYGLRGLETRGVCPECTKSVYGSRDPHFRIGLRWARRAWIGLFAGTTAFGLSLFIGPLSWVLGVPAVFYTGYVAFLADRGHLKYAHQRRQIVAFIAALASVLIGGIILAAVLT
jgi:predicted Zn-ribbon and HTH transcriptional regulator